jgi:hypothetical protein
MLLRFEISSYINHRLVKALAKCTLKLQKPVLLYFAYLLHFPGFCQCLCLLMRLSLLGFWVEWQEEKMKCRVQPASVAEQLQFSENHTRLPSCSSQRGVISCRNSAGQWVECAARVLSLCLCHYLVGLLSWEAKIFKLLCRTEPPPTGFLNQ